MAKAGRKPVRPESEADFKELETLLTFYPSKEEIMAWFDCSKSTIEAKIKQRYKCDFQTLRDKKFVQTRIAIRRKQIKVAIEKENPTMLIWLGKIILGQSDSGEANDGNQRSNVREIKLAYSIDKKPASK